MDKSFTKFLQEEHAKNYHGTDDDMPDAFDAWLTDLQVDLMIAYAELFAAKRVQSEVAGVFEGLRATVPLK